MKKVKMPNNTNYPISEININAVLVKLSNLVTSNNTEQIEEIVNILQGNVDHNDLIKEMQVIDYIKWDIESDGLLERDPEALQELAHIRWNLPPKLQPVYFQLWKYKHHKFVDRDITFAAASKSNKNYMKFFFMARDPQFTSKKLSKRNLPTEIFKYLISNGILDKKDFYLYSTNSFGRKFAAKLGDILLENEISEQDINYKRFNRIDFNNIKNSHYKGVLYISNQWDVDSINQFCNHILTKYPNDIYIDVIISERDLPSDERKQYNCKEELYAHELKNLPPKEEWVKNAEQTIKLGKLKSDEHIIEYSPDLLKTFPKRNFKEFLADYINNKKL